VTRGQRKAGLVATPNPFFHAEIVVTGAGGGLGRLFVEAALARGARKVHGCVLRKSLGHGAGGGHGDRYDERELDVTSPDDARRAALELGEARMVVNCAGIELKRRVGAPGAEAAAALESAVNYLGIVNVCEAFLPVIVQHQGATIINVLSIAGLVIILPLGAYCASKAAGHFYTCALREEVRARGIAVHGAYPGWVDTAMAHGLDVDKASPRAVVDRICDSVAAGEELIFPDAMSRALAGKLQPSPPLIQGFS
jgi:NAD(P)-dependent dehydrogenase (short-subunit alcohol dehydrogenase family)